MTETLSLPVFGFLDDHKQANELRTFLRENGAQLDENAPEELVDQVFELIDCCETLGELDSETEVEMILNSICSLLIVLPPERSFDALHRFCTHLGSVSFSGRGWSSKSGAAVRVLSNLFHGFSTQPTRQHRVFVSLVPLCARAGLLHELPTDVATVRRHFAHWSSSTTDRRQVLRLVHQALVDSDQSADAAESMVELLATYTDQDADKALDDAAECVRAALIDPKAFSFDHLLSLRPVQLLETAGREIHSLLRLFIAGTLKEYRSFVDANPTVVNTTLKVDWQILTGKMRLLTLLSMAERNNELSFDNLSNELDLPKGEKLEEFIIEAIQIGAISGRIDEFNNRLIITSFQHRTFGRAQWEQLQQRLTTLSSNLKMIQTNLINTACEEN